MIKDRDKAIEILKNGGIVIFPTDTAFGIGCRIDDEKAIEKLLKIRKRSDNKPILVLVDSIEMAEKYVSISSEVRDKFINKYWPGPLTIVLLCDTKNVPSLVRAGGKTLAVRIPSHKNIRSIIKKVGVPILAPSANFSGEKTPFKLSEVDKKLISLVDFVLSGRCPARRITSTVVDCSKKPVRVLRKGAVLI